MRYHEKVCRPPHICSKIERVKVQTMSVSNVSSFENIGKVFLTNCLQLPFFS